jgi:molecular chaperone GrpE
VEILDDINLAKTHGEFVGGFQQVGEKLSVKLSNAGLVSYGEPGEPFDPNIHEAIAQEYGDDVLIPTISKVLQSGYSFQEKVVRPAVVVLKVPEEV